MARSAGSLSGISSDPEFDIHTGSRVALRARQAGPLQLTSPTRHLADNVLREATIMAEKDMNRMARPAGEPDSGTAGKPSPSAHPADETILEQSPDSAAAPRPAASAPGQPTSEELKRAMKAFRKRMKLTRLNDESKLGRIGNPMSGGRKSEVAAIMAPREFPKPVWDELVRQGRLRSADGVFYELAEE